MKTLINRFRYENLRNEAHVQLHESFIALVTRHNAEVLGIQSLYAQYVPLLEQEKLALDLILKSGLTDEILAQDRQRDQLFRGFVDAVKSGLNHYDPAQQEAAEKIQFILTRYGNLAARPLDQETAAIDDLHRELADAQNATHIATLGLGDWLTRLVEANRAFDQLMMSRYTEAAARPTVNMRTSRGAVDTLFRAMLDLLEAQAMVNGEAKYTPFVAELNAITQRYENILAANRGRAAAKPTEPAAQQE